MTSKLEQVKYYFKESLGILTVDEISRNKNLMWFAERVENELIAL